MSSFSIYDLSDSYLAIQDMMLQGDDSEELSKHLDAIDDAFEDKAESYAIVMKNLDASIDALKQEVELELKESMTFVDTGTYTVVLDPQNLPQ